MCLSHYNERGKKNNFLHAIYDLWFISNSDILYRYFLECDKKYDTTQSCHALWRLVCKNLNLTPYYYLYVGKDYELVRRYYYDGHGKDSNSSYTYPDIEKSLEIYRIKYSI